MSQFELKIVINIVIGLIVTLGFIIFMAKNTGWFKEGGIIYEIKKGLKSEKEAIQNSKTDDPIKRK